MNTFFFFHFQPTDSCSLVSSHFLSREYLVPWRPPLALALDFSNSVPVHLRTFCRQKLPNEQVKLASNKQENQTGHHDHEHAAEQQQHLCLY